jgi:guanine deaminase
MIPGLVDLHTHWPQMAVTGQQSANLLTWLAQYIFPEESKFVRPDFARRLANWYFRELLRNGTTLAAVFTPPFSEATRIGFETAERLGNRVVMGRNLMDRNAPEAMLTSTERQLAETETLAREWHGRDDGRLQYAWLPRFALSCSEALLDGIGDLRERYPDVYCHTHLSEQKAEIRAVLEAFPTANDYTGVYEGHGLVGRRSLFAHAIHLSDEERHRLREAGASLAHCPSANFFLKSGRFRWRKNQTAGLSFGLGSDVGAGPELSLFRVMRDAQYMQPKETLSTTELFHAATLGGAKALDQADRLGNFQTGKDADFLVLKPGNKPSMPLDWAEASPEELLSLLIYHGDDRIVSGTFIRGRCVYAQQTPQDIRSGVFPAT